MEDSMEVVLFAQRHFNSKDGTELSEILGLNLDSKIFFTKIMSKEDWVKFGLNDLKLYYNGDNNPVCRLMLKSDGFNTKIVGSKQIGEGEFEIVLSEKEVDKQLNQEKK
jgi:hypothetical protein